MAILRYPNNILTHVGQTTVAGFGGEIMQAGGRIRAINNLRVVVGYHGTAPGGNHFATFNAVEQQICRQIGLAFSNVILDWYVAGAGMTNLEIQQACANGNVFFTWCDSDNRVKGVVQPGVGAPI